VNLTSDDILRMRLYRQLIARPDAEAHRPADIVEHLGAMQAQDYLGSLWSVGLRCGDAVRDADVEHAIAERQIVRTWPMRGTLHFLPPGDVRWILGLLGPRMIEKTATRRGQLELTDDQIDRARGLFVDALSGGRRLARPDAMKMLEDGGISTKGQRGYHVLWHLSQQAILCCGPMAGRQQTFVLLDEWVPPGTAQQDSPPRAEALTRLAARYLVAHGPATVEDFAWWAGVTKTDARAGLAGVAAESVELIHVEGVEYRLPTGVVERYAAMREAAPSSEPPHVDLLSGFDEYMLGYTGRRLQLGDFRASYGNAVSANGTFSATLVVDGHVTGLWRRVLKRGRVEVAVRAFRQLTAAEKPGIDNAASRYAGFLGLEDVVVELGSA